MITFLTLFLGLTIGSQAVELEVRGEPARVVLSLDGETVAERDAPPWRFECDFGAELAPRRLEAVAYDAEGAEIARVTQPINLSSRRASLALALEAGADGEPAAVRPVWRSAEHPRPATLTLELDGTPLPAPSWDSVALPALDLESIHFVAAEAVFPDGAVARAETAFGGLLGPTISTENTAVAVVAPRGRALRAIADAEGLLTAGDAPATVLAVEHGAVDLVAVVTPAAFEGLAGLRHRLMTGSARAQLDSGLDRGDRLFLIDPVPELMRPGHAVYEVYSRSGPFDGEEAGLALWLSQIGHSKLEVPPADGPLRPTEAVAVAAMQAVTGTRPRAVLLVLGRDEEDAGLFSAETVRRYLQRMRVPLTVWYVEPPLSQLRHDDRRRELVRRRGMVAAGTAPDNWNRDRGRRLERLQERWGEVTDIDDSLRLIDAAKRLRRGLDDQRVIWLDGAWLPNEVELTPAAGETAGGVRWAG